MKTMKKILLSSLCSGLLMASGVAMAYNAGDVVFHNNGNEVLKPASTEKVDFQFTTQAPGPRSAHTGDVESGKVVRLEKGSFNHDGLITTSFTLQCKPQGGATNFKACKSGSTVYYNETWAPIHIFGWSKGGECDCAAGGG